LILLGTLVSGPLLSAPPEKATICHLPPDDPSKFYTLRVPEKVVVNHVNNHSDLLGACSSYAEELCDDGNMCTIDTFPESSHECVAISLRASVDCDDNDPNTIDSCGAATGCFNDPISQPHSLRLDGVDDYLSISDSEQTGLESMAGLTFEVWVNFDRLPASDEFFSILDKAKGGISWNDVSYYFYLFNQTGVQPGGRTGGYELTFVPGSATQTHNEFYFVWADPTPNTWHHIAVTFNGSTGESIAYIDGVEIGRQTKAVFTIGDTPFSFLVGARNTLDAPDAFFEGRLDDIRVWNKVRTIMEINNDLNTKLTGAESGLVGYWTFDDDFKDSTMNDNDLYPNGGAYRDSSNVAPVN